MAKFELIDEETGEVSIEYSGRICSPALFQEVRARNSNPASTTFFEQSVSLGAYALSLDTTSVLISRIEQDLNGRLSDLRLIYEKRKAAMKSSAVGKIAERGLDVVLQEFSRNLAFDDVIVQTGDNASDGSIRGKSDRKLGDLEIRIGGSDLKIVVESKYTGKGPAMGDITLTSKTYKELSVDNHARGQVKGAQANRQAHFAIFVTKPGSEAAKAMGGKTLILDQNDMAVYVVVNHETGDFEDLKVAYMVARAMTLSLEWPLVQQQHLRSVAALLIRSTSKLESYKGKLDELVGLGIKVTRAAEFLVKDFAEDNAAVEASMAYLDAVMNASNSDALELKVRELNELTNDTFTIREVSQ